MHQKLKKYTSIILTYQNYHFKTNNLNLLYNNAANKYHSNDIKIDTSIGIVLRNLNEPGILPPFFK